VTSQLRRLPAGMMVKTAGELAMMDEANRTSTAS
jgi:hypothetical protein